jgi:hypothetical protein
MSTNLRVQVHTDQYHKVPLSSIMVLRLQARGHWFEPSCAHQVPQLTAILAASNVLVAFWQEPTKSQRFREAWQNLGRGAAMARSRSTSTTPTTTGRRRLARVPGGEARALDRDRPYKDRRQDQASAAASRTRQRSPDHRARVHPGPLLRIVFLPAEQLAFAQMLLKGELG